LRGQGVQIWENGGRDGVKDARGPTTTPKVQSQDLRSFPIRVPIFGTLTCHISNNSNFMELTFQPMELENETLN